MQTDRQAGGKTDRQRGKQTDQTQTQTQTQRWRMRETNNIKLVNSLPWCTNCVTKVSAVVSCPPPWVAVEKSVPAGLPTRAPVFHRDPVESMTTFS